VITREDLVNQSVQTYVRAQLAARGYTAADYELIEDFDYGLRGELGGNIVAIGVAFDDQGRLGELGSDLRLRTYTVQTHVFGLTLTWAKNLAHVVKFALDRDGFIPLLNVGVAGNPQIGVLEVEGVSAERQHVENPEPWQRFIYAAIATVEDAYNSTLA
jgi:hypothetical protein